MSKNMYDSDEVIRKSARKVADALGNLDRENTPENIKALNDAVAEQAEHHKKYNENQNAVREKMRRERNERVATRAGNESEPSHSEIPETRESAKKEKRQLPEWLKEPRRERPKKG